MSSPRRPAGADLGHPSALRRAPAHVARTVTHAAACDCTLYVYRTVYRQGQTTALRVNYGSKLNVFRGAYNTESRMKYSTSILMGYYKPAFLVFLE